MVEDLALLVSGMNWSWQWFWVFSCADSEAFVICLQQKIFETLRTLAY